MKQNPSQKQSNTEKTKKPYHQPKLITYGNIREITKNVGNAGMLDGGTGMKQRSQP